MLGAPAALISRRLATLAALALHAAATGAFADEEPSAGPAPPPASAPVGGAAAAGEEIIESTRQALRSATEWLARGVDSWFGDIPFERRGGVSEGRLKLGFLHRQDTGTDHTLQLNARFRLPNVERKAYFLVGRDNEREVVADQPGSLTRQQRMATENPEDTHFFAGLGVALHDAVDLRIGLRGGLKPYAQARYSSTWSPSAQDRVDARQTVFWTLRDHLGSTSAVSYQHDWSPRLATRWLNSATITRSTRRFEWGSVVGGYALFERHRVLSLEAIFVGAEDTGVAFTDYGLRVRWEQPLDGERLSGELIVGHFRPRPDASQPRGRAWAVGAGLLLRF